MPVVLKYGDGVIAFDVPDESVARELRPSRPVPAADPAAFLAERTAPCPELDGREILVLLPDGTRTLPVEPAVLALAPLLERAEAVHVLLATGTHRPDTPDNDRILKRVRSALAERGIRLDSAAAHDCRNASFYDAGAGIRLNTRVDRCDAILIAADMAPHYFAGYSSAIKYLLPGVAAFECIEPNHALALDPHSSACRHPLHPDPPRRANPVAEGQLEVARLVTSQKPVFALATVSAAGSVCWGTFGPLEDAVAEGIRFVNACLVERVERRYRRVVVSCGGYPNDETMYIAQRSLELTQEAYANGAEILWLAECRNGIASSETAVANFFTPLKTDPESYVRRIGERYVMFGHKAVRFVRMMERVRAIHVASALPPGTFPAAGMVACGDPKGLVARWVADGEEILFIHEANKLAVEGPAG